MKLVITMAAVAVFASTPVYSQTVPNIPQSGRTAAGAPLITKSDMQGVFSTKADYTGLVAEIARATAAEAGKALALNGTLTAPTITGGNMTGAALHAPTINLGLNITGSGEIVFVPRGSPLAGSRASSLATYTMNHSVQEFSDSRECDSLTHSPSLGGNVCHYTYIEAHPTSGQVWGRNVVTSLISGFDTTQFSALGDEIDINNQGGDYGTFATANSIGLLFNGLGKMNTAAVSVQTGNTTGVLPIWYNGYYVGPNAVSQYSFHDTSNAATSFYVQGSHQIGINLSDANTSSAAITLGNGGATQGIVGRVRGAGTDVSYQVLSVDAQGHAVIGASALGNWISNGNMVPAIDNTYAVGTASNRFADLRAVNATLSILNIPTALIVTGTATIGNMTPATDNTFALGALGLSFSNVFTKTINSVPTLAVSTPASSSATCTAGQQAVDAAFHYDCVATNTWRRVATGTW